MKKVVCFGTFDIIHPGHLNYFRQAKKYGNHLTIVVARDETIQEVKGRAPMHNQKERIEYITNLKIADKVVTGNKEDKYKILEEIKPDVICLGYDQVSFTEHLKEQLEERGIHAEVIRAEPYKEGKYKSSIVA